MAMFNPAHLGEILRELVLEPLGISVSEAAVQTTQQHSVPSIAKAA